jgi:hypothetical protein
MNGNSGACRDMTIYGTINWTNTLTTNVGRNLVVSGGTISGSAIGVLNVTGTFSVPAGVTAGIQQVSLTITGTTSISGTVNFATSTNGTKTFVGLVTNQATGTWNNPINEDITLRGGLTNNGTFTSGSGTYTFNTNSQAIGGTSSTTFAGTLAISGSISVTNNTTVSIAGNLTGSASGSTWVNSTNSTINISGSVLTTGTLTASAIGNTVNYNANAAQTVEAPTTYYNLTISGSNTKTLGGAITVNGSLTVNNGTLADGGFQVTGNGSGDLNLAAGTILQLGAATATTFPTNFTAANISLSGTSEVNYNSNVAQTISGTPTYGNLTLSSTGSVTKTVSGSLTVNGTLTIGTNNTLSDGGNTHIIKGDIVNNGNHSSTGAGKILLSGGSVAHAISGATSSFGNLQLDDSKGASITGTGTTTISGNLAVTSGILTINAFTTGLIVNGTTGVTGTITLNSTTGTRAFKGLVTINSGGIWSNTANEPVTFQGGITNNGTFTAGTGMQTFAANNQAMTGTFSIPDFYAENISVTNNGTLTVSSVLSGTGGLTQSTTSILNIGGTSGISTLTATSVGNLVNYYGTAQTVKATTYNHLTLSGSGIKTTTGVTINGVLSMEGIATASAAPTYVGNASLQYNTATSRNAGVEWLTPFAASGGVLIANTGTITLNSAKVLNASVPLTINSGASLSTANNQLTFGGNFINNGTFTAGSSPIVITDVMVGQNIDGFTTTGLVTMSKTWGTATFQ